MSLGQWIVGALCGLLFGTMALGGERVQRALEGRRLRRHTCPTPCEESCRCRCGCGGLHLVGDQKRCGLCGTEIVHDEEDPDWSTEITDEMPAPKGFTSWGWERDREFRRHMRGW